MSHWKIDEILELLREAGSIAFSVGDTPETELKADQSVVTAADKAIEALYARRFDRPECGTFMIGEETIATKSESYLDAALKGCCYIVDPIDGTAPFAANVPLWGSSIGLMEDGVLTEGAIYLPVADVALCTCRGTIWEARQLQSPTPSVLPFNAKKMALSAAGPVSIAQTCAKTWTITFPNQAFAWSSCVGSYYGLLTGHLLGYLQCNKLWDLAGGMPILKAAGFFCSDRDGRELDPQTLVSAGIIQLEPGPQRWNLKNCIAVTPDQGSAEYIWQHVTIPKE